MKHCHRLLFVSLALAAMVAFPEQASARPVKESVAAPANGSVDIEVVATEITIVGGKAARVAVAGELPDEWKLDVDTSGSRTHVKVTPSRGNTKGPNAELKITVPAGAAVRVRSVSGDVRLSDLSGNVRVSAVSGDVEGSFKGRELEVKSVSGDIEVRTASSRTTLQSVSGDVTLDGGRGELAIKTVSGEIAVTGASVSRTDLASTSGDIGLTGEFTANGPHVCKSHSGDIDLRLTRNKPIDVSAKSHSGEVEDGFAHRRYEGRKGASFSVGTGGPRVELRTFSGDIRVAPR